MQNNYYSNFTPSPTDYGAAPFIVDIDCSTKQNPYYRRALWTGDHLQLTLMSIPVGGSIGLEMHPNLDQFIRIEAGNAVVMMGKSKNELTIQSPVNSKHAIIIPAGSWHNLINTGCTAVKLYSIYAPPEHPFGIVERKKNLNDH